MRLFLMRVISGAFHRFSVLCAEQIHSYNAMQCKYIKCALHIVHQFNCDTNCALHDARCLAVQLHTADCRVSQLLHILLQFVHSHVCITFVSQIAGSWCIVQIVTIFITF